MLSFVVYSYSHFFSLMRVGGWAQKLLEFKNLSRSDIYSGEKIIILELCVKRCLINKVMTEFRKY